MIETLITYVTVSARGKPIRSGSRVSGALLTVGRASRCQIHLLDPRIALEHAQIAVSEVGATITAPPGRIRVNGKEVDSAQLEVGDRIEIDPFVIEVAPRTDVALALAVTQVGSSSPTEDPLHRIIRRKRVFPRRRVSYLLFFAVLLGALAAPVALDRLAARNESPARPASRGAPAAVELDPVARSFLKAWNPGPLMQSHQVFGANCRACHDAPFVQVRDQPCLACHATLPEHTPRANLDGPRGHEFASLRCAQCHREHKGETAAVHAQDMCAGCHRDIRQWSANAVSENVGDFAREHPPFRLQMVDPAQHLQRVRQQAGAAIAERSNLKFNHKFHLDPAGLRTPEGRKRLACADCHQPNDDGMLMAPVSMKKHCESCHTLAFDPATSRRTLPHAPVEQIAATLRDFYARQALGQPLPRDAAAGTGTGAARPGTFVLNYQERQNVLGAANRQARAVLDELFGKREVCSRCHEVSRIEAEPHWAVAPVRVNSQWMPRARFTHARHATMDCVSCHDVAASTRSSDVAMPEIGKCRECHVGARPLLGKVTSDCAACHRFHAGEHFWQGGSARKALGAIK